MTRINVDKVLTYISFFAAMTLGIIGEYAQGSFVMSMAVFFNIQSVKL